MKYYLKNIPILFLFLFSFQSSFGQGMKDRLFIALGWTAFLEYAELPSSNSLRSVNNVNNGGVLEANYSSLTNSYLTLFTYAAKFRYNLIDLNENASLSFHIQPALGLGFIGNDLADGGWGSLSIPFMLGYNIGNVSTYNANKNKGFGIAVGVEYFSGALLKSSKTLEEITYTDIQGNQQIVSQDNTGNLSTLFAPAFEISYRYWTKANKAHEFSLLVSLGSKGSLKTDSKYGSIVQDGSASSPFHIRLLWSKYLNY
ncbi:MAG TPA: hypothetical protein VK590_07745 [Saprospiraceae bacterium]|nr:hypothetical protein [Saprospiraceae bacterium]